MVRRYRFEAIFYVYLNVGIIVPRFNVIINNTRIQSGQAISKNSLVGGLDLFNYVGHSISGEWDPTTRELTILGFY